MRDIKVEEFVSDISSSDEECNACSLKKEKANEQSGGSLNQ